MCGEAAGDSKYIPLLLGLGLDEFSMNPVKTLEVRKTIRELDSSQCNKLANKVLDLDSAEEVEKAVLEFINK
ncbi:Phosphoenolpyruvate-protein phosphotransferase [compost metagenome]